MKLPKVLVFTPIYEAKDYCLNSFLKSSRAIKYPNKRHIFIDNSKGLDYFRKLKRRLQPMGLEVFHIERGANSREALARAQNFARKKAIDGNYDYMFSLESDIMVPDNIIEGLMSWGKDVVTGLYFIGQRDEGIRCPCVTLPYYNDNIKAMGTRLPKPEEWPEWVNNGLKRVNAGGFGTCLIHKDIFKKFPFTFDPRFTGHSDVYFFNDCWNNNIPVYVDTHMVCDHQNSDWREVEDR